MKAVRRGASRRKMLHAGRTRSPEATAATIRPPQTQLSMAVPTAPARMGKSGDSATWGIPIRE